MTIRPSLPPSPPLPSHHSLIPFFFNLFLPLNILNIILFDLCVLKFPSSNLRNIINVCVQPCGLKSVRPPSWIIKVCVQRRGLKKCAPPLSDYKSVRPPSRIKKYASTFVNLKSMRPPS